MTNGEILGSKLYELRKKSGLSQEAFAEKLGVSRQAVSKWECGASLPDTDNLITISKLYGVSLDELIGNEASTCQDHTVETAEKNEPEYEDEDEKAGYLSKKDHLTQENLPDGMLEDILSYIRSVDESGIILNVYLVRKTISETFFTSAFIIHFYGKPFDSRFDSLKICLLKCKFYLCFIFCHISIFNKDIGKLFKNSRCENSIAFIREMHVVGRKS
jgi:transcriptional regulator with XRE-family HTH domain